MNLPSDKKSLLDRLGDRLGFLHGRPSPSDTKLEQHLAEVRDKLGLNVRPGPDDDGWADTPPVTLDDGTRLHLYKDGEAAAAAYDAIQSARWRVLLEIYIWPDDETGRCFAELLAKKAREGVKVFVIFDSFGSLMADAKMFASMREAGVQVLEFHPMTPWHSRWGWRPLNRDHRKLVVVDDRLAGVGGLNIGNDYAGTWVAHDAKVGLDELWRDAGIGFVGKEATEMFARAFDCTWSYLTERVKMRRALVVEGLDVGVRRAGRLGKVRHAYNEFQPRPGKHPTDLIEPGRSIACIGSAPTLASPLRPFLYRLVRDARKSLLLTMAYFAPDDELIEGLCAAARRGVRVRLVIAGKTDAKVLLVAARAFYRRLLEAGCEVYERQGAMLHQKSIVADGELTILGSTNLDYRSIEFNLELSAVVRSRELARQVELMFDHDTKFSNRIELSDWRERPYADRLVQWAVSRLRYLL